MTTTPEFHQHKTHLQTLMEAALSAANPARRIEQRITEILKRVNRHQKCWVVGAGKASLEMALALDKQIGDSLAGGAIAVVPERLGHLDEARRDHLPFQLYPASHPLPTEKNIVAAKAIAEVARQAGEGDLLLVLISGGGSAHLALPINGLNLTEYQDLTDKLMRAGAAIQELNAVRKHAEQLKGGGLLRLAAPAEVYTLILSDVIGDSLAVIASGPVSVDPTTFGDAWDILKKYDVEIPLGLHKHLEAGMRGEIPETLKGGDPHLKLVSHAMIGSNLLAVEAVKDAAIHMGFSVLKVETGVEGEAREIGEYLGELAHRIKNQGNLPGVAILGGETTVTVKGSGRGGRNQEMVLSAALAIEGMENVVVMSFATDGIDGPTDAAGAYADGKTIQRARDAGINPRQYLANNDSYSFFDKLSALIKVGPTGTNVNDISLVLVYP